MKNVCMNCEMPSDDLGLWHNETICPNCFLVASGQRKPQMNFIYLHTEKIGYGNHGIQTHEALTNIGIDVYDGLPGSGDEDIEKKRAKVCKDVVYLTIPSHVPGWWDGQRKHLFTMWETDTLPESLRDNLRSFDTIIVPSQECLKLYSQYHDNVKYVPLGVNADRWKFRARRKPDTTFTFLVAGSGKRKGSDLVFRAFQELFPNGVPIGDGPIPRLIFKNPKGESYNYPGVEVLDGFMSAEEEVELYASANCYVQPSRGEGWGMQPLQAMAQGCPTILTDAHGHAPFAKYGLPISATKARADYMDLFGESGDWWEPNYDELKALMLDVYSNYEAHEFHAASSSIMIEGEFTWEKSAAAIVDAIGGADKLRERFTPAEISEKWVVPERQLFRVVARKNHRADIGGTVRMLEKGKEYWLPADTKRVLFETSVLDPSCLGTDEGLAPSQIDRIGEYTANATRCPTCGHSDYEQDEAA
jgi:glycosyltransferase involved in cell wall biosynthesis